MLEQTEGDGPAKRQRKARRTEAVAVVLISLSGLATSWSSYQASRWSGEQSTHYVGAVGSHMQAARWSIEAGLQQSIDVDTFIAIVAASADGRSQEADFLRARLRAEFRPAFEAWAASLEQESGGPAATPFLLPEYRLALKEQAAQHQSEALERFVAGQRANEVSDQYMLMAVVLASVMFLSGICQPLQVHGLKIGLIVLASVLMVFGLYNISVLPIL